nr:translation initiation factor IF-2-like [Equus asinus]
MKTAAANLGAPARSPPRGPAPRPQPRRQLQPREESGLGTRLSQGRRASQAAAPLALSRRPAHRISPGIAHTSPELPSPSGGGRAGPAARPPAPRARAARRRRAPSSPAAAGARPGGPRAVRTRPAAAAGWARAPPRTAQPRLRSAGPRLSLLRRLRRPGRPRSHRGGQGRWWARSPGSPPARARRSFLPASPDGARSAAVAAAAPPGSGARAAAAPPPPRPPSPAPSSPCAPLPSPRAAPSPSPARLRRPHPPRAVTLGDSALATFAAPTPAPARPSDADPGVGRPQGGGGGGGRRGPARPLSRRPRRGSRRAAHSHGSWEEPSGRPAGGGSPSPAPGRGRGREGGPPGVAAERGRRLGPARQLQSEPGRFAIKKIFFILMCELPNIVFQRAHPANPTSPGRLPVKRERAQPTNLGAGLAPTPAGWRLGARLPHPAPAGPGVLREVGCDGSGRGRQVRGAGRKAGGSERISASRILPPPHRRPAIGSGRGGEEWESTNRSAPLTTVLLAG